MRKLAAIIVSSVLVLSLAACSSNQQEEITPPTSTSQTDSTSSAPTVNDNETGDSSDAEGSASDGQYPDRILFCTGNRCGGHSGRGQSCRSRW